MLNSHIAVATDPHLSKSQTSNMDAQTTESDAQKSTVSVSELNHTASLSITENGEKNIESGEANEPLKKKPRMGVDEINDELDEKWYESYEKKVQHHLDTVLSITKKCNSNSWHQIIKLEEELQDAANQKNDLETRIRHLEGASTKHVLEKGKMESTITQLLKENVELKLKVAQLEGQNKCMGCDKMIKTVQFCSSECIETTVK